MCNASNILLTLTGFWDFMKSPNQLLNRVISSSHISEDWRNKMASLTDGICIRAALTIEHIPCKLVQSRTAVGSRYSISHPVRYEVPRCNNFFCRDRKSAMLHPQPSIYRSWSNSEEYDLKHQQHSNYSNLVQFRPWQNFWLFSSI